MPLKIFIVDDHPLAREAIRTALLFCRSAEFEIVGEAADGNTALALACQLHPDVVTMDLGLPDMNGLEATRRLKTTIPAVKVIIVTIQAETSDEDKATTAGAMALVTKDRLMQDLPTCLDLLASQNSS